MMLKLGGCANLRKPGWAEGCTPQPSRGSRQRTVARDGVRSEGRKKTGGS